MSKYEWRDATVEDVGKGYKFKVSDSGEWGCRPVLTPNEIDGLRGEPGKWNRFEDGLNWRYAQVYAPVEDDATQAFQFPAVEGMTLWDWYAGLALVAIIAAPDSKGNYSGSDIIELATKYAEKMMEARK